MRPYLSRAALYYVVIAGWLVLFQQIWRLILLVRTTEMTGGTPGAVLARSFLVGLRFDLAIAGYIILPLVVLGMLPGWDIVRSRLARWINFVLLCLIAGCVFFIHLTDIEFFRFFNVRLNGTAHLWQESPQVMFPMVWETYPVVRYLILYAIILAAFVLLARHARKRLIDRGSASPVATNLVYAVLLIAACGLAIRGRIEEKSPLRWGVAYFSGYAYANQLALSPVFTYVHDLVFDAGSVRQVERLMEDVADPEAETIARDMLGFGRTPVADAQRIHRAVRFDPPNPNPPNVIVVIMESFGSSAIGVLDHRWDYALSPCFDSLAGEGILFTNIYSGGMHTYTGILSTLYGYPSGFGNAVMKRAQGRNHPWGLPQILRAHGYRTLFFTTSDPHFDNMQGFLVANGIETISSLFDYDPREKLSTMGVPDHVMFDRALQRLREDTQPFLAVILTGSNHGPWIIPDVPMEPIPQSEEHYKERMAFKYSDWALGRFVRMLDADSAFDNTLVVVTADNGLIHHPVNDMDLSQFRIPLLLDWIGAERPPPLRCDRLGSQVDIVTTTMAQVRLPYDDYTFGRNLLDTVPNGIPFAFFSEWYKIGYIEDGYFSVIRLNGPHSLYDLDDPAADIAGSFPDILADYRRKALAIYQTAYHNLQRPLLESRARGALR